jgi:RNA polymerase sigma factor (sigma-70 family)
VTTAASDHSLLHVLADDSTGTVGESAMETVARRYSGLVYQTARRLVHDADMAEDVTQATFIVLAKKADHVDPRYLPGWLVNTARFCALEALRSRSTRQRHEALAAELRAESAELIEEPTVPELMPLLDEALANLSEADRTAVVARFFQGQSFAYVGESMGITEEAARKRVTRAVDKMRATFMREGILASVGLLMLALASEQAKAAPLPLIHACKQAMSTHGLSFGCRIAGRVLPKMSCGVGKILATLALAATVIGGATYGTALLAGIHLSHPATAKPAAVTASAQTPISEVADYRGR